MFDESRRRQALARLGAITLAIVVIAAGAAGVITARQADRSPAEPTPGPTPAERTDIPGQGQHQDEIELASKPMLRLPPRAAQPQPLSHTQPDPPITLPHSKTRTGQRIPSDYPPTAAGALAQLVVLTEEGLRHGTPEDYAHAYRDAAQPGAVDGDRSGLAVKLRALYQAAELDPRNPSEQFGMAFRATHGLIKGAASGGRYVVACVLGELTIDHRGHVVSAGLGDCQAMRRVRHRWGISSGVPAAPAPSAWPGSDDCVAAGYRELR